MPVATAASAPLAKAKPSEAANGAHTEVVQTSLVSFLKDWDWKALFYLTGLAFAVRLAFLHNPSSVVFDEVHFGGFAQKYLKGQFFMDLHPPLARLLVTLSAWVGGWDASFSFYNIGADYLRPGVPYITMRAFTAVLGALVVPILYVTLRGMGVHAETAAAISTMTIFENGLATQSRLILLDSYLVFFTTLTAMFWVLFRNLSSQPFTRSWKLALLGLGSSMALAASCKWVGLFLVAGVGLYTIVDLWRILGDTSVPLPRVARHLFSRVVGLIFVPMAIYMMTFYAHFALQTNYTVAASSMSIEYQCSLNGGQQPEATKDLYYGAVIRLRHYRATGPYLHSHNHVYPEGSKQQQVTGYHHRDSNNLWILRRPFVLNVTYTEDLADERTELVELRHGAAVRLEHMASGRFLHSHPLDAPVSAKDHHHEVSAYGHNANKFSDLNDNWTVQVVDDAGNPIEIPEGKEAPRVFAIGTKFRLTHRLLGCSLQTAGKALPDWGFKQNEITCSRDALRSLMVWVVEHNEHPLVDAEHAEKISYKPLGFLGKFLELNKRMWQTNAGLSADHPFGSRPMSWPLLSRGLGFWNGNHVPDIERVHRAKEDIKNGLAAAPPPKPLVQVDEEGNVVESDDPPQMQPGEIELTAEEQAQVAQLTADLAKFKGAQIYLIGNPLFWWATTAAVALFTLTLLVNRLASRRSLRLAHSLQATLWGANLTIDRYGGFMFLQWFFHFLPFFGMQRQLFLHHYFPALYFAILLLGLLTQTALDTLGALSVRVLGYKPRKMERTLLFIATAAVVITFIRFAPLGYGFPMTKTQCTRLKWLARWDFDCSSLPEPIQAVLTTAEELTVG